MRRINNTKKSEKNYSDIQDQIKLAGIIKVEAEKYGFPDDAEISESFEKFIDVIGIRNK